MRLKDWLEISTVGFAQRQADRPPEHLLKEVIQNALDAVDGVEGGFVDVTLRADRVGRKAHVRLTVLDNGPGIRDPSDLRTVFSTGKTDSFLVRGRLGQGFKEILCLCARADVRSGPYALSFTIENWQRVCDLEENLPDNKGTSVTMWLPWKPAIIPDLEHYLHGFIVPKGLTMKIDGQYCAGSNLPVAHAIDVVLKTELFQAGKWVRRERRGTVDLVAPPAPGAGPMLYEMGIPVQELDWTQPYHANVQMRVPMNPRRDAVAAGYLKELYSQILPVLLPKIQAQDLRDEWVSNAVEISTPEIRKEVVVRAFGEDAVRSVPTLGRHDFDSDAREMGLTPIDTSLLPKGLRDAAREVLPSSRDAEMERVRAVSVAQKSTTGFEAVKQFTAWLAGELVQTPVLVGVVERLSTHLGPAIATWCPGGVLTLNASHSDLWINPLSERFLGILVHECAHERAPHHGDDFHKEAERMAGRLALLCLERGPEVLSRWATARKEHP